MSKITVVEVCPICGEENEMQWDFERLGLNAFCPVCGTQMMLCDECFHRDEFDSNSCNKCKYKRDCTDRKLRPASGGPAYDVEITETLSKTVCVNADTTDEAEKIVSNGYVNGDYILDENDLVKRATIVAVRKIATPAE